MLLTPFFEKCQEDGKRIDTVVKEMLPQLKTMKTKTLTKEIIWHLDHVFAADERVTAVNAIEKLLDLIMMVIVTAGDIEKHIANKKAAASNEQVDEYMCNDTFERLAMKLMKPKVYFMNKKGHGY